MIQQYKNYIPYLIIAILLIVLTFKCESDSIIQNNKPVEKIKVVIKNHFDTITKIETKIKTNTVYVGYKIDSVSKFNNSNITNYYQHRYNVTEDIKPLQNSTSISDSVAILNITELVKYDNCIETISLKDDIIDNHLFIEAQQDSIISIVEAQKKEIVKEYKKERRQTKIYQIALIIVSVLGAVEILK